MAHIIADRVADTSITTGTGNISVSGTPPTAFQTFDTVCATSDTFWYVVVHRTANEWEVGLGTYNGSGVIARTTVLESSNADAAVSFSAGTKDIWLDVPAQGRKNPLSVGSINSGPLAGFRNHIINGAMMVAQRGTSFTSTTSPLNSDDTFLLDRWILLSDGNDIVDVTQATEAPTNGLNSIGLDVETVDKKFGILQVLERKNCVGLIGNTVTLSAQLKVTNATRLDKIKMAIISWSSTADAVTSDIISAWGVDGTNPTLVANWTYENTPADLGVTTSWARYSVTAAVDTASTANIGVFIWSDNVTDTDLGDFLYVTDVQLEIGSVPTTFERRPVGTELALCQRYYFRSTSPGDIGSPFALGMCISTTTADGLNTFPVTMRIPPTAVEQSGTATHYRLVHGASASTCSAVPSFNAATTSMGRFRFTVASGLTAGDAAILASEATTSAFIGWSAEL